MCREGRSYVGRLRQKPPVRAAGSAPGTCRRAGRRSIPGGPARPPAVTSSVAHASSLRMAGTRTIADQPASRRQQRAARSRRESPRQLAAVGCDPRRDRGADARAQREQLGQRLLHGRADRQIRVGDQLQPGERRVRVRSTDDDPAELQVRQTARLRQPAQAEDAGARPPAQARSRRARRAWDRGRAAYGANTSSATIASSPRAAIVGEPIGLVALDEPAGRVVGTRDDDGARPRAARRAPRRAPARCSRSRCPRRRRTSAGRRSEQHPRGERGSRKAGSSVRGSAPRRPDRTAA